MPAPTDRSSTGRISQDELSAWMGEHGPALKRYFQRKVSAAEAEDLVQDVFLAMHARDAAGPIDNVQRYLFTVAAHVLARRRRAPGAHDPLDETIEPPDELSPERHLISRQDVARVIVAIRALPPRCREAFVLHRFEDMTYAAIARRMGVTPFAVRNLVSRAIHKLADALGEAP